jgi:hypothetical protein
MERKPDYADAPLAVGLLALHDKRFFEALLKDPTKALQELADSGRITFSARDRQEIIRLVAAANQHDWNPLEEWERYKKTGIWAGGWPMSWVECR